MVMRLLRKLFEYVNGCPICATLDGQWAVLNADTYLHPLSP